MSILVPFYVKTTKCVFYRTKIAIVQGHTDFITQRYIFYPAKKINESLDGYWKKENNKLLAISKIHKTTFKLKAEQHGPKKCSGRFSYLGGARFFVVQ